MRGQSFEFTNPNDSNINKAIKTTNWLDVPLERASVATRRLKTKAAFVEGMKNFYKRLRHPKEAFEEFENGLLSQEDKEEVDSAIRTL